MTQLTTLTAFEMRQGLLAGDFSSVELVEAHLERIAECNPQTNSFISVTNEHALSQAKEADKKIAAVGKDSPALTGIPLAVKDIILTKGFQTTCASKILGNFVPPYSSTAYSKAEAAGAILVGKTNQDEFGMGTASKNSAFGEVKNPWDLGRVPGGSSGGSAAAVSFGASPIALSTDTGGSIRQPASYCGIFGLKPTYGRVSRYGVIAFASSLDQVGPHARSVEDIALSMEVISGKDPQDGTSSDVAVEKFLEEVNKVTPESVKGLRIGIPKEYAVETLSSSVKEAWDKAAKTFEEMGAEIVEVSLPHTQYALPAYYIIAPAEASSNLARYDGVRYGYRSEGISSLSDMYEKTRSEGFGAEVKRRILIGTFVLSAGYYEAYYHKAQQVRTLIIDDFKSAFANNCDLILAPVTLSSAFKSDEKSLSPLEMYLEDLFTTPANLAGLPGLTVPVVKDSNNLPLGLQIIGPAFSESKILQAGKLLSDACQFDTKEKTNGKL